MQEGAGKQKYEGIIWIGEKHCVLIKNAKRVELLTICYSKRHTVLHPCPNTLRPLLKKHPSCLWLFVKQFCKSSFPVALVALPWLPRCPEMINQVPFHRHFDCGKEAEAGGEEGGPGTLCSVCLPGISVLGGRVTRVNLCSPFPRPLSKQLLVAGLEEPSDIHSWPHCSWVQAQFL